VLDPVWARTVLELEGLGDWRVMASPAQAGACCCGATREIVLPCSCGHGLTLHEIAHARAGVGKRHRPEWREELARLIDEYTVPVCRGPLGLEGM